MHDILPGPQSHIIYADPYVDITEWDAVKAIDILNKKIINGIWYI